MSAIEQSKMDDVLDWPPMAFPSTHEFTADEGKKSVITLGGMRLRDYFAAAALAKIIDGNRPVDQIARMAYEMADALLAARSKS